MPCSLPDRNPRGRVGGIGEHPKCDGDVLRIGAELPVDRRAAARAEVETQVIAAVGRARVGGALTLDLDLVAVKPGLRAERCAGAALAGEAVADRDPDCLAVANDAQPFAPPGCHSTS